MRTCHCQHQAEVHLDLGNRCGCLDDPCPGDHVGMGLAGASARAAVGAGRDPSAQKAGMKGSRWSLFGQMVTIASKRGGLVLHMRDQAPIVQVRDGPVAPS